MMISCSLATVFLTYCLLSYIFRRFPRLLSFGKEAPHTHKLAYAASSRLKVKHISHRGGAGENLENTMIAFDHAARLGTDMFELDCHLTKDGQVVVVHDNDLRRLCGRKLLVSETNYADLPSLLPTQSLDFNHKTTLNVEPSLDRRILLLEELFQKYPSMPMNVDIKVNNEQLMLKVNELIINHQREHLTVWGNGLHQINTQLRKINPRVGSLFSVKEVLSILLWYYTGLLPFVSLHGNYFEIPMCQIFLDHFETFPERNRTVLHKWLLKLLDVLIMNKKLIEYLRSRGIETYVFVLNVEHEWTRAVEASVSGIMTDFPTKLSKWLDESSYLTSTEACKNKIH